METNGNGEKNGRSYWDVIALWCLLIWMVVMSALVAQNIMRTLELVSVNLELMSKAMIKISQDIKKP